MSIAPCLPRESTRRASPYAAAPRLPAGEALGPSEIFGTPVTSSNEAPAYELEIGPGRGHFILERAALSQDIRIVGLEIRLKWASLVDERLRRLGQAGRARVFAEDIRFALPRLAAASLSRVFVHFPDPWWKKRHAKRRLANAPVIEQVARLLRPGGELFVQTDVWDAARAYQEAVEAHRGFTSMGDAEGSPLCADNPYGARSPRERRVMADDMPIIRLRYQRLAQVEPV
jgi:tRNA (guanine-N7-)-methyltransferase